MSVSFITKKSRLPKIPYQYFSVVSQNINTKHTLIDMIEKAKKIPDKGETFGAVLTDLLKAFDCMTNDGLIAKLHALNFVMNAFNF